MADDQQQGQAATGTHGGSQSVVIPQEVQQKFPELISLILGSESMNDDERQYWINILPLMTPEQLAELKRILVNEKEQLAAIDRKYAKTAAATEEEVQRTAEKRGQRRKELRKSEEAARAEEKETAEGILEKIEGE